MGEERIQFFFVSYRPYQLHLYNALNVIVLSTLAQ